MRRPRIGYHAWINVIRTCRMPDGAIERIHYPVKGKIVDVAQTDGGQVAYVIKYRLDGETTHILLTPDKFSVATPWWKR